MKNKRYLFVKEGMNEREWMKVIKWVRMNERKWICVWQKEWIREWMSDNEWDRMDMCARKKMNERKWLGRNERGLTKDTKWEKITERERIWM